VSGIDLGAIEPFDQIRWLGDPPWGGPLLAEWEAAHCHDARVKCYVEYGCQAVEVEAERLRARVAELEAGIRKASSQLTDWGVRDHVRRELRALIEDPADV
jgi:hypothetical protein